jgi:hypothetical protein
MRRIVVLVALSVPGRAQSAQALPPPPIVVKVEAPPTSPWMRVVELVIPGIIGAGAVLIGVWLTNKHSQAINEENHRYEKAKWQKQEQVQLKKDFYFNLIRAAYDFRAHVVRLQASLDPSYIKARRDAVERLKLALSSAISPGWILLSKEQFEELLRLDALALNLMAASPDELEDRHRDFRYQLVSIAGFAKQDLSYNEPEATRQPNASS